MKVIYFCNVSGKLYRYFYAISSDVDADNPGTVSSQMVLGMGDHTNSQLKKKTQGNMFFLFLNIISNYFQQLRYPVYSKDCLVSENKKTAKLFSHIWNQKYIEGSTPKI